MLNHALSFTDVAGFNKAAGDSLRLEILRVLAQDAYGVLELCEIFEHKQSGMSHHLKVLAEAGLVVKRREGNSIFYSRALPQQGEIGALQQQLSLTVDGLPLSEGVIARREQVQQQRVLQSQQFFIQQANRFKAQQDLIAEYPVYGDEVAELLQTSRTPARQLALEIGPGAGEFLPVLAGKFERVIAIDNATTMLANAREYCEQAGLGNVEFVHGDTRLVANNNSEADCVVMNMVLHHTPSPADIFADLAKGLKQGGVMLITDLCRHDQDWAKTACGDIWLGFDPEELKHWASLVNLEQGFSRYLALRNGFQIQLQQFIKR